MSTSNKKPLALVMANNVTKALERTGQKYKPSQSKLLACYILAGGDESLEDDMYFSEDLVEWDHAILSFSRQFIAHLDMVIEEETLRTMSAETRLEVRHSLKASIERHYDIILMELLDS